jgi:predicted nucleic acid-binding protein
VKRVFLDANVLFSAAYREAAGLAKLWTLPGVPGVALVTSRYAEQEARRNLDTDEQRRRLDTLMQQVQCVDEPTTPPALPPEADVLPPKDRPILAAAVAARCHVLLTGDTRHFGPLLASAAAPAGVLIQRPADFIHDHESS